MADGSTRQLNFAFPREIIVDLFAGGGGASLGIEQAFGRPVDLCVNHSADAVAMHAANHPHTEHLINDVFEVDPVEATKGRQVGLLWASPDCKHFSKAKGGKPRSKKIRSLAWVVVKWAKCVKPRVIMLENVEEFVTWGPLGPDGQPCPVRKGFTFKRRVRELERLGYKVEHRELRACDYGAPTIRKRFFLIARCDGLPIRWAVASHAKPGTSLRLPAWRTAAECIDWARPCPSIFLTPAEARVLGVKRPLVEATMKRIYKGVQRFVLQAAKPFIVPVTHPGDSRIYDIAEPFRTITGANRGEMAYVAPVLTEHANASGQRVFAANEPLRTQCAEIKGGHFALASAFLTKYHGENAGSGMGTPFPTVTSNGESKRPGGNPPMALVAAHLEQANGGFYEGAGRAVDGPAATVCAQGSMQRLVATSMVKLRGDNVGSAMDTPLHTVSAQGTHHAEVRAFLIKFYSCGGQHAGCDEPMHTVPTRDRMGLVTVDGTDYAIADIGLRMLTPRELFRAQGFPESYIIDQGVGGRKLPKDAQVRMCGNSVCPPMAKALVEANVAEIRRSEDRVAA